jgi:ABC-type multidrug transport system fused ATPase/permease subunit
LFDENAFDEEKFYNAIKLSKLETLIKNLPNGIETFVGEKGKLLSGGEIQRLRKELDDWPQIQNWESRGGSGSL